MTSFNLNYLPKSLSLHTVTLGVRALICKFGGNNSMHSTLQARPCPPLSLTPSIPPVPIELEPHESKGKQRNQSTSQGLFPPQSLTSPQPDAARHGSWGWGGSISWLGAGLGTGTHFRVREAKRGGRGRMTHTCSFHIGQMC